MRPSNGRARLDLAPQYFKAHTPVQDPTPSPPKLTLDQEASWRLEELKLIQKLVLPSKDRRFTNDGAMSSMELEDIDVENELRITLENNTLLLRVIDSLNAWQKDLGNMESSSNKAVRGMGRTIEAFSGLRVVGVDDIEASRQSVLPPPNGAVEDLNRREVDSLGI